MFKKIALAIAVACFSLLLLPVAIAQGVDHDITVINARPVGWDNATGECRAEQQSLNDFVRHQLLVTRVHDDAYTMNTQCGLFDWKATIEFSLPNLTIGNRDGTAEATFMIPVVIEFYEFRTGIIGGFKGEIPFTMHFTKAAVLTISTDLLSSDRLEGNVKFRADVNIGFPRGRFFLRSKEEVLRDLKYGLSLDSHSDVTLAPR